MWKHKQKPGAVSALKSASINGGDYMKNILRFLLPALALIFTVVANAASYKETTLYNFRGQKDGNGPGAKLVADASGNLYGTTLFGGGGCSGKGCGAIFELSPSGTGYTEKIIYGFKGTPDAESPTSILIDASGNLYGTSFSGGSNGDGTVWELSPSGSSWTETILHNFNGTDGGFAASLITDGTNFYGVAEEGGAAANGAVFELSPSSGGWTESVLYSFTGGKDGAELTLLPSTPPATSMALLFPRVTPLVPDSPAPAAAPSSAFSPQQEPGFSIFSSPFTALTGPTAPSPLPALFSMLLAICTAALAAAASVKTASSSSSHQPRLASGKKPSSIALLAGPTVPHPPVV
jgi:uncharacterized repeat protein (TIGR03803 family)